MPQSRKPEDPEELALVLKALRSGLTDWVEWQNEKLVKQVRNDPDMCRLRPQYIKKDLIEAVVERPDLVVQVRETRPEYMELWNFYYKFILCYEEVPHDVFVEMILNDLDPDLPAVTIVSVHPQRGNE